MPTKSSDVSILTEAYMLAGEIVADVLEALEAEIIPLMYTGVSEAEAQHVELTPEKIEQMSIESGHYQGEAEPCATCQLIAARYNLE